MPRLREVSQGLLLQAQQALPLGQERRAARLHLQRAKVQLLGAVSHRARALGHDDFVGKSVFPQHFLTEDAVTIVHQPLAQRLLAAIGLQDQTFLTTQAGFTAVEDVANPLTAHPADADRRDGIARLNRRQTISQAHANARA